MSHNPVFFTLYVMKPPNSVTHKLEKHQVGIYFGAVVLAPLVALLVPGTAALEGGVNPALALMLFVTFLQVPLADLGRAFGRGRFLAALLITNFVVTPLLVAVMVQFLPPDPMVRLGVLLVLLTPCIDYVVTFSHLGRANARLLLAATPTLLVVQMRCCRSISACFSGTMPQPLCSPARSFMPSSG